LTDTTPISRPTVEARRRQILAAASDCARRAGFHGARMAEIAQAAGLSVGQIYRYFENKEAIIGAIIAEDVAEKRRKITALERSGTPLAEAIVEFAPQAIDDAYESDRATLMLEVAAEAARNPAAAALLQAADAEERAFLLEILKRIAPERSEWELAARGEVLGMLFDGMAMRAVAHPGADRAAIGEVLRSVLRRVLSEPLREPGSQADAPQTL
jgi:AcrR family transcriptional regulator